MRARYLAATVALVTLPGALTAQEPETMRMTSEGTTVTLYLPGQTITRSFPPQSGTVTMTMAPDRRSFTVLTQGVSLLFHRVCGDALDLSPADEIEGLDPGALRDDDAAAWRGSLPVTGVSYDYVAFEQGDGSYRGFTVISAEDAVTRGIWQMTPEGNAGEVASEPEFTEAQRNLALDLLSETLELPRKGLGSYVTLSRLPSGGQGGFGPGVVAEIALDADRRAMPAWQLRDRPCADPAEGGPVTILTVRIFREGATGEPPEVQVELSDPRSRDIRDFGIEDADGESRSDYRAALSEAAARLQTGAPVRGLAR